MDPSLSELSRTFNIFLFLILISFLTVRNYVTTLVGCVGLEDKLSHRDFVLEDSSKESLFPPHLTPAQVHEGIKSGKLLQGSFMASRDNFLEGSVNVEGQDKFVSFIDLLHFWNFYSKLCVHEFVSQLLDIVPPVVYRSCHFKSIKIMYIFLFSL